MVFTQTKSSITQQAGCVMPACPSALPNHTHSQTRTCHSVEQLHTKYTLREPQATPLARSRPEGGRGGEQHSSTPSACSSCEHSQTTRARQICLQPPTHDQATLLRCLWRLKMDTDAGPLASFTLLPPTRFSQPCASDII